MAEAMNLTSHTRGVLTMMGGKTLGWSSG